MSAKYYITASVHSSHSSSDQILHRTFYQDHQNVFPHFLRVCQRLNLKSSLYLSKHVLRRPYNLYCVGADVKPCSINQACAALVLHIYFEAPVNSATTQVLHFPVLSRTLSFNFQDVPGGPNWFSRTREKSRTFQDAGEPCESYGRALRSESTVKSHRCSSRVLCFITRGSPQHLSSSANCLSMVDMLYITSLRQSLLDLFTVQFTLHTVYPVVWMWTTSPPPLHQTLRPWWVVHRVGFCLL